MVALLWGSIRAKKVSRAVKIRFRDKWVRSSQACGGIIKSSDEFGSSFVISFESDCWVWPQQWIYVNVLVWFGSHDHHFKTAHKLKSVGNESNDSMVILMICLLVNLQVFFRHQTDFASHLGLCFLYKVTLLPFLWTLLAYFYFACILLLCF